MTLEEYNQEVIVKALLGGQQAERLKRLRGDDLILRV